MLIDPVALDTANTSLRIPRVAFVLAMLVLTAVAPRFRESTSLQDFMAGPPGLFVAVFIAASTVGTLIWWNWSRERRPFVVAVLVTSVLETGPLFYGQHVGWLGGIAFRSSVALQLLIYGPALIGVLAVPLGVYRWIAGRSRKGALIVFFAIVAAVSIASVPVEQDWLKRGVYAFDNGYSIAADVFWGAAQYLFGLGLYELLRWRAVRSEQSPGASDVAAPR